MRLTINTHYHYIPACCVLLSIVFSLYGTPLFSICLTILALIALLVNIKAISPKQVNSIDLLLMGYVAYVIGNILLTNPGFITSADFFRIIQGVMLYACVRVLAKELIPLTILVLGIMLLGAAESMVGLLQLYGFRASNHSMFAMTGSFFNPGPFAGFLSTIVPVGLGFYLYASNRNIKYGGGVAALLMISTFSATWSRASWVAAIVGMLVVFSFHPRFKMMGAWLTKTNIRKAVSLCVLIVLVAGAGIFLFQLKYESALGRILMYKVSWQAFLNDPFFGAGFNMFRPTFGAAQVNYFGGDNFNPDFIPVAGTGEYAFNETMRILVEEGLVGLLLFGGMIGIVCVQWLKKRYTNNLPYKVALAALISLIVFAQFSYPFDIRVIHLLFYILLGVAASFSGLHSFNILKVMQILGLAGIVLAGVAMVIQTISNKSIQEQYQEALQNFDFGNYEDAVNLMAGIEEAKSTDGYYYFKYGQALKLQGNCEAAIPKLERAIDYYCDPYVFNNLGLCYQETGNYEKAAFYFYLSHYLMPYKLYPIYLLAKLYEAEGEKEKAMEMANYLLNMEVKVPSPAITEMREEMNTLLQAVG